MRLPAVLVVALSVLALSCALAQQPIAGPPPQELAYFQGETQALGDGLIYSWVRVDQMTHPVALGVTLTEDALANLPDANTEYVVKWPDYIAHAPFDHFALDWLPRGHMPEQFYGVPHFDFHFYMISPEERAGITGAGRDATRIVRPPAARYLPAGYQPAPPPVPYMGVHWVNPNFPEFHGRPFTQSLLFGSYNGRLMFIEPMITRAFLMTRPNVDLPIPQPQAYRVSGYYPTRYTISYDAARHQYTVALTGMTYRRAS